MKTEDQLREGISFARGTLGVSIVRGPWFSFVGGSVVACDAVGSVLLHRGLVSGLPLDLSRPGYVGLAMEALGVDFFWLRRFWLGWDRGYQVTLYSGERETPILDEVSRLGIRLWREVGSL